MALDIKARISADTSGFRAAMSGLEGATSRVGATIRNKFLAAFSAGAVIQLIRSTFQFARDVDRVATKFKLSEDSAQQLLQYAQQTGNSFESIVTSADALSEAWKRIGETKIQPLFTKEELADIREADATITRWQNQAKVAGVGWLRSAWRNPASISPLGSGGLLWNRLGLPEGGPIDWAIRTMQENQRKTWSLIGKGAGGLLERIGLRKPRAAAVAGPYTREYEYEDVIPPDIQALWIDLLNKESLEGLGSVKAAAKAKSFQMRPASDALARIGGFVGGGTDPKAAMNQLRAMTRHLSNIERTLVSRGIKIQDLT